MNEKLQYATMLEIPVNTCNITYKSTKRKKLKKSKKEVLPEEVKEQLLKKVNEQTETEISNEKSDGVEEQNYQDQLDLSLIEQPVQDIESESEESLQKDATVNIKKVNIKEKNKKSKKLSIIGVQFAIIGLLVGIIFLTNSIYADSGINVFMRSVFGGGQTTVESKIYSDFSPVISLGDNGTYSLIDGVVTCDANGSVYSPCNGKITSITQQDGKFTMEIEHSSLFRTVIAGLDYAYQELGSLVYANIPVGYSKSQQVSLCFKDGDNQAITDYSINGNQVVWAV